MVQANHPAPLKGYAICTEPRSGSNYLCQLLESTGVLGRPRDYLNVTGMRAKGEPDYPASTSRQVETILGRGCGPNNVYGFKLFSVRFDDIAHTGFLTRMPNLHFVHLERRDLLGQAMSDWKAVQTSQYRAGSASSGIPRYDRAEIVSRVARFAHAHARWRRWFARNGLEPLELIYEDVVGDPQRAAERVADYLGIAEPARVQLEKVEVTIQRDSLTSQWREQFLREERDLNYLDEDAIPRVLTGVRRLRRRLLGKHL